jgi:hypothetical protein
MCNTDESREYGFILGKKETGEKPKNVYTAILTRRESRQALD